MFTCHINRESIQYQHHHSNYSVFTYHIYRISIHASTVTIQCLPATYTEFLSTPPQLLFSVNLPHIQNIYPHLHSNYSVFTCHIYRISIHTSIVTIQCLPATYTEYLSTPPIFSVYLPHIQNIYSHFQYLVFICHIYRISVHISTVTIQGLPSISEHLSIPSQ